MKPWTEALIYWSVSARRDASCFISFAAQGDFNGQRSPLITVIAASLQSTLIVQQRIIVTPHSGPFHYVRVSLCAPVVSTEFTAGATLWLQSISLTPLLPEPLWNLRQIIKQRFYLCPLAASKNKTRSKSQRDFWFHVDIYDLFAISELLLFCRGRCAESLKFIYTYLKYFGDHHNKGNTVVVVFRMAGPFKMLL